MSVQNPKTPDAVHWLPEPDSPGQTPKPVLRSWLTETGLLTARMRRLCPDDFRLQVLADDTAADTDALRRVLLCCGAGPCIYAETILPAATRAAHPWLCELGSEPLGEALRSRPDVQRGPFEFALFAPAQLPADVAGPAATALWARRSVFYLGSLSLTVTEIFLPGILDCENRRVRIVD